MLSYFTFDKKQKLITSSTVYEQNIWIHAENPTDEEKQFLVDTFQLEKGHIYDALDENEVPRFEIEGTTQYLFIRFPYKGEDLITTIPLLLVITEKSIITVTFKNPHFFNNFQESKLHSFHREEIVLYLFSEITKLYHYNFNAINKEIRQIRRRLEKITNKNIVQFVTFEEVLNDFRPSLIESDAVLSKVLHIKHLTFSNHDMERLEDIHLSFVQLIESCIDTLETIRNIREAYTTILTNNLNNVIKLFTSLTVILTVPTIIASLFGMNVALPFADNPYAFTIVVLVIIASVTGSLYIFKKKDWL